MNKIRGALASLREKARGLRFRRRKDNGAPKKDGGGDGVWESGGLWQLASFSTAIAATVLAFASLTVCEPGARHVLPPLVSAWR